MEAFATLIISYPAGLSVTLDPPVDRAHCPPTFAEHGSAHIGEGYCICEKPQTEDSAPSARWIPVGRGLSVQVINHATETQAKGMLSSLEYPQILMAGIMGSYDALIDIDVIKPKF
jgi:hypothetical protein